MQGRFSRERSDSEDYSRKSCNTARQNRDSVFEPQDCALIRFYERPANLFVLAEIQDRR
jgi:hypothetical protein